MSESANERRLDTLVRPLQPGQRVTYVTNYGKTEIGIVKRDDGDFAFVVYHCDGDWSRYAEYTAARTDKHDLTDGWPNATAHVRAVASNVQQIVGNSGGDQ